MTTTLDTTSSIEQALAGNDRAIASALTPTVTARAGKLDYNAALDALRNGEINEATAAQLGLTLNVITDEAECAAAQTTYSIAGRNVSMAGNIGVFEGLDGKAKIATSARDGSPWHRLANHNGLIVPDYMSITEALEAAGVLYEIDTIELSKLLPNHNGLAHSDLINKARVIYRTDTRQAIAPVGNQFTVWQPEEIGRLGERILQVGRDSLLVSAVVVLGEVGERFAITFVMPDDLVLDVAGAADHVRFYLSLTDWCDGHHSASANAGPWRIVCDNTNRWQAQDAAASVDFKHMPGIKAELTDEVDTERALKVLDFMGTYRAAYEADARQLITTPMTRDQMVTAFAATFGPSRRDERDATTKQAEEAANRIAGLVHLHDADPTQANITADGPTAWSVINAGTRYLDHLAEVRVPKAEAERAKRAGLDAAGAERRYRDLLTMDPDNAWQQRKDALVRNVRRTAGLQTLRVR
jgi:phage/plasmid-like protein (TIGR03299 family)